MRKIPDSLLNLQQKQREETISVVKTVVQELKAEGAPITIKRLCKRTGLSRSVFSKPHVKVVVEEVIRFQHPTTTISDECLERQYTNVLCQLEKSKRRETDLKGANIQLRETVQELRSECELLRGELHSLMQQHGVWCHEGGEKK